MRILKVHGTCHPVCYPCYLLFGLGPVTQLFLVFTSSALTQDTCVRLPTSFRGAPCRLWGQKMEGALTQPWKQLEELLSKRRVKEGVGGIRPSLRGTDGGTGTMLSMCGHWGQPGGEAFAVMEELQPGGRKTTGTHFSLLSS